MKSTRDKLTALPKDALVDLVLRLGRERNAWRKAAHDAVDPRNDWHRWTPEQTRANAAAILAALPLDPDAPARLDMLAHEIGSRRAPASRPRKAGPRCRKGRQWCGKPLNDSGQCSRHDAKAIRAARAA